MPDLLVSPCAHLVTRNDAEHRYYGPDGLPFSISVTGVLSANDPPSKRAAIEATRHRWERRPMDRPAAPLARMGRGDVHRFGGDDVPP